MAERFKYLKPVGAIAAAAALTFGPTAADSVTSIGWEDNSSGNHLNVDRSFLDQLDDFTETDYGRVISHCALVFSLAGAVYALQKGLEIDDRRKFTERMIASASLLALSSNLVFQSYGESDPIVTASALTAYVLAQSAYNYENLIQTDRGWGKRLPGYASICSLLLINGSILAETIEKY